MRHISWMIVLALAAVPARAADEPKPNTLTPKEIADGWLLLFDGETTFGWQIDGAAKVEKGVLILGGEKETKAQLTTHFSNWEIKLEAASVGKDPPTIAMGRQVYMPKNSPREKFGKFGDVRLSIPDPRPSSPLVVTVPAGSELHLRSVRLQPSADKEIFNGKDLTGWKKFTADEKRAKTEFSVTKDGYLHLKNGPGDLQTEGQYDDFVLQVECRTNGDKLNSGVFFRCIPGEYQNGYEAQIHNGYNADKPKEYTVEEYDPKTHELKDKKKVKSAALDYGTGAIYRRVPARKQAAKDNEWFTMTVVAQGRHVATWVNGIQMVDWTDNRPDNKNPRNGYRAEKGPISLQGHDPTTDIDFRNIRIAELPKPKEK